VGAFGQAFINDTEIGGGRSWNKFVFSGDHMFQVREIEIVEILEETNRLRERARF
jgi:hypothetical protein